MKMKEWIEVEEELEELAPLFCTAYPGLGMTEEQMYQLSRASMGETVRHIGLRQHGAFVGAMRLHDFSMNFRGVMIEASGLGSVAVDFCHKKEGVALELVKYFLKDAEEKQMPIALLYPFNPAFYRKMGFGHGTRMNQYQIRPELLPAEGSKAHIRLATPEDAEAIASYHAWRVSRHHGLIEKTMEDFLKWWRDPQCRVFVLERFGGVRGYMWTRFKKGETSFLVNDLFISEFACEDESFLDWMAFLQSQRDQIRYVLLNTQEEEFYLALDDPRNGSDRLLVSVYHETNRQGSGVMYRVVDAERVIMMLDGTGIPDFVCRLTIRDDLIARNDRVFTVVVKGGQISIGDEEPAVSLTLDIADFSSLVMGAATLRGLVRFGKAHVPEEWSGVLGQLFGYAKKPFCTTGF